VSGVGANGNRNTEGEFPLLPRRNLFGDLKIWNRYIWREGWREGKGNQGR